MRSKDVLKERFRNTYFAHRGLHNIYEGIPENSIAAFKKAVEFGYGVELDVQLSKDGKIVVFHDTTLNRMCGVSGRVSDYTYSELCSMPLHGTLETIPLFKDVLMVLAQGSGPLIVELKAGLRSKELCQKARQILKTYPGIYCIESFDPFIVKWFQKHAPEVFRGQLARLAFKYVPQLPCLVSFLLSRGYFFQFNTPDFIAYEIGVRPKRIQKLQHNGTLIMGWTSKRPRHRNITDDAIIFEQYLPQRKK